MEYKTVKFWEDIYNSYVKDKEETVLCSNINFKEFVWGIEEPKDWIRNKAKEFVISTNKDAIVGMWYLFASLLCFNKDIRIEFLKWLINDLKNGQNILHRE